MPNIIDLSDEDFARLGDDELLTKAEQYLMSGDHEIAKLYRTEFSLPEQELVLGFPSADNAKKSTEALLRGVKRFANENRKIMKEICEKFEYCKKLEEIRKNRKAEIDLLKDIAKFLSMMKFLFPLFSFLWYIFKHKLLDDFICECDKSAAAAQPVSA